MGWREFFVGWRPSLWLIVILGGSDGFVNLEEVKVCGGRGCWYMYGVGLFDVER